MACADDFGPHGDIRELRFAAQRLLAHAARESKIDPNEIRISDVVVVKDAALLSWTIGTGSDVMGLIRQNGRWWYALHYTHDLDGWNDATSYPLAEKCSVSATAVPSYQILAGDGMPRDLLDAAVFRNRELETLQKPKPAKRRLVMMDRFCGRPAGGIVSPGGGTLWQIPSSTSGYEITIAYSQNNAPAATNVRPLYARPPTEAEIIPYPTTLHFISTAVLYFDLTVEGSAPVTFQPGTTIDIWFPFVLDDELSYDLTIGFADGPIGPIYSKPFDNVLHYKLPGFTATPGRTLMAEIDGNWP